MKIPRSKKSILIVEDEPFLVEMYKTRFLQDGYKVYVALNGTPVMGIMKKHKPNIVLLDIVMPEKNGYEVLKDLKGNKETRKERVVIFSNRAQDAEVKKGMAFGADDYFVKSDYTPTQIVAKVEKMINESRKKGNSKKKKAK